MFWWTSYDDGPTHFSEVVGILPLLHLLLLLFPLLHALHLTFSGDEGFYIQQCQVAYDWIKSVHLWGTLAILHQMAGLPVLNIDSHDLCGSFCFLIKDSLLQQLEAVLMLQVSPGSVRGPQGWSLRQWICFGSSSLTVQLVSTGRRTHLLGPKGSRRWKKWRWVVRGQWLTVVAFPCWPGSVLFYCQSVSAAECMAYSSKHTFLVAEQV